MAGSAAEAKFGILIEGKNQSQQAFDQATASNRQLTATVERLIQVTKQQAADTRFMRDAIQGAAEESKRLREEQARVTAEAEKQAAAQRKAAAETRALAEAQQKARDNAIEWATAIAATGALLMTATSHAGDFQEKIDLVADGTGLAAKEIGALTLGAQNVGRTFEQISPSLDIFIRKLAEARQGAPEAVRAFQDAGVTDLNQPTGTILQDIGAGMNSIQDPVERSRVAFELFGRSFRAMSQVITQDLKSLGDEAVSQGAIFTGAMEEAARDSDIHGDKIKGALSGIQNQISVGLASTGGNALAKFFEGAFQGFATFLTLVNQSDEALGKFQVGIESGKPTARFVPGSVANQNFYGDAYTRYTSDFAGVGTGAMSGPDLPSSMLGTTRDPYGNAMQFGPTAAEAKKALDALAKSAAQSAEMLKNMNAVRRKNLVEAELAMGDINPIYGPKVAHPGAMSWDEAVAEAKAGGQRVEYRANESAAALKDEKDKSEALIKGMMQNLASSFSQFISSAITGTLSLGQAFDRLVGSVMDQAIQIGVSALFSMAGFQSGGSVVRAQSGLIGTGLRGADTNLIAAGYGETMIVDHTTTDGLRLLVPKLDAYFSGAGQRQGSQVVFGQGAFQFNIDAGMNDPNVVQELVNDKLIPAISKAMRYGTARRAS